MGRKSRSRALAIWVNGMRAGEWRLPTRGGAELAYDPGWMHAEEGRPLSLSLPFTLDNEPLKGQAVENYFDNLLPDSDPIRRRIQQRFRTGTQSAFDLLTAIGRDCVGAVQLLPLDEEPVNVTRIDAQPLSEQQIEALLLHTVSTPSFQSTLPEEDFRISIAGAQEKTALLFHEGRWCRPLGATPTTHIFKLPLGRVGGMQLDMTSSVENEWLCAKIMAAYEVPMAGCEIQRFGSQTVLVVERFDRQLHSSGDYWLRLVQEDMCQATATPASLKYERDGGPGIDELAAILRNSLDRDADLRTLLKAQILFWMLAAADGHAKNFSIRLLRQGRFQLTPLYDVLSFFPIMGEGPGRISPHAVRLAMAVRGKNKHYLVKEIRRRHFDAAAKRMGVAGGAEPVVEEILAGTAGVIDAVQKLVPAGFPQQVLDSVVDGLASSASKLGEMEA